MGSHILDILRQGIWASLTGGWFYDPQQQVFCNTFHLYIWVLLLAFPLAIYATTNPSVLIWSIYCGIIGVLFTVIKVINFKLHHLFDTGESEEEVPSEKGNEDGCGTEKQGESKSGGEVSNDNASGNYIEMATLGPFSAQTEDNKTVSVSHVNLQLESDKASINGSIVPSEKDKAPLAEVEGDDITAGSSKCSKQRNSSSANEEEEEDSPDVEDVPRTITTRADIEVTPKSSTDIVDKIEEFSSNPHFESNSAGLSQDNTKENCYLSDETGRESDDRKININGDVGETPKEIVVEAKGETESDFKPRMRFRHNRRAVRRSKSTQEWTKPTPNPCREKLSSHSLNMPVSPKPKLATLHHSTSSNSDWSDVSFGEVEIPDGSSCGEEHSDLYLSLNAEQMMSSSIGESSGSTLVATSSSQSQFGRPDSPVFLPVSSVAQTSSPSSVANHDKKSPNPSTFVHSMWSQDQGDADTDSLTSGGDTASHSSDTSSSVNLDPNIVCLKVKDLDLTTPSSPSAENLDMLRQQGAIPKKVKSNGGQQNGNPKESTSPGSTDSSDPEEIRRRLIEILWDPQQHSEELRQLQLFVKMKKSKLNDPELSLPTKEMSSGDKSETLKEKLEVEGEKDGSLKLKLEEEGSDKSPQRLSTVEEERKSTTPTEFSALLPVNPQLIRATNRRARRRRTRPQPVLMEVLNRIVGEDGHLATSHNDTTDGAVHWFQDEQGNWMSYTFGENSTGAANNVGDVNMNTNAVISGDDTKKQQSDGDGLFRSASLPTIASNSTVVIEGQLDTDLSPQADFEWELPYPSSFHRCGQALLRRNHTSHSSTDSDGARGNVIKGPKPKHFYKFWLWPLRNFVKIHFDRLSLLAALDRNISVIENVISVLLAMCVGALGALMICSDFYHDLCLLLFCFIMAGCQYSLLKSVQPDAASPMHGYNRIIVFSRPFYFCVCCSVVLLLDMGSQSDHNHPVYLYGIPFTITSALTFLRNFLTIFILSFPLLFTLGLLPQVNTFLMYLLEQIDMHLFGGNATTSLLSSFYCVCRSCLSVLVLYGFASAALKDIGKGEYKCDGNLDDAAQTVAMSILCGLIVSVSYHLSRSSSDPGVLWMLIKDATRRSKKTKNKDKEEEEANEKTTPELVDPLPEKLKDCLKERLQSDMIVFIVVAILVFAVHVSTAFTSPALQPVLSDVLYGFGASFGFVVNYIIPQTRKEMPWLCCSHPLIRSKEWMNFGVKEAPKVMIIEYVYLGLRFIERNVIYPVICMCATTTSTPAIVCKFGSFGGPLIVLICSMKLLRSAFSDSPRQYLIIAFTHLFFKCDFKWSSETFLIDYFFVSILFSKFCDFLLKLNFIITYIAPWQIIWGSAFHAVVQPLSVPHSAMLFLQASVSAIFSTPLSPFLGSAIFTTSYVRPVKFWERDYNTRRVDHTNTRLASQLDCNPGADANNLNSIFYEHLTRSLQHSLCGDLLLGRWGNYTQGDCFIMASDYLNALVHIIEVGNGVVTFQLRGLEFRGTYCQQREVEAITEGIDDNQMCCCFEHYHHPHCLSVNAAFSQRWLAWEVVVAKYILEGYSITDNSAATVLQVFELRKALITYYIKSIIYYTVRAPNMDNWLNNSTVCLALEGMEKDSYVDLDPTFNVHIDEDYDVRLKCISRASFCQTYLRWIQYCAHRRDESVDCSKSSKLVSLCFALSLLARRALSAASQNSASVDCFLYGLHALFKGDFRIQSPKDEWVFADMDMIRRVVAPAVRMSLKLHQDHFLCPEEYLKPKVLYHAITDHEQTMVIAHEADPAWRNAVLSNVPSLLALRHVFDEGTDEYKIIRLNKRYLSFRIVKVNRECVRGLWAGQQQELIFLRNRNPERGSIQNAKQALRNMINSSCDQPIGYPIYVSPLTASYATTHDQLSSIPGLGAEFKFMAVKSYFTTLWNRIRSHCDATCAGGSASFDHDLPYSVSHQVAAATIGNTPRQGLSTLGMDIPLQSLGNRGSLISTASSASKINTLASLANLINDTSAKDTWPHRVRIVDPGQVYESINHGRRYLEVQWPNEEWRKSGGKTGWQGWAPKKGMEGTVVHRWSPGHPDPAKRSHVDKTIILIQVKDHYVPIAETGVFDLGAEV